MFEMRVFERMVYKAPEVNCEETMSIFHPVHTYEMPLNGFHCEIWKLTKNMENKNMDKLQITKDLIRIMALYGIVMNWNLDVLRDEYKNLGIPDKLMSETLREGAE